MKEIRFCIDMPSIKISRLSENHDFQIDFEIKKDDFVGVLKFNLDPDSIEWDLDEDGEVPRSFSRLIVSLSTKLEISRIKLLENAYFLVLEYLDFFIQYIQIELGQYWVDIGPIKDWSMYTFLSKTKAKLFIEGREENIGIPFGGRNKKIAYSQKRRRLPDWSDVLDIKQVPNIKTWIEQYKPVVLEKQLLADSKRLLLHGDYKLSSVLAMTALEGPLKAFVKARCKSKGTAKKSNGVANNLNLFPSTLEPNELTEWLDLWVEETKQWHVNKFKDAQIINWAIELNQARNKTVHEGITPDFDTLDKGIFAVEALYEFTRKVK
jgi:hypothetical protein